MKKERHVLVVFPHPDDEAFGVSGTLALHIENGTPVTYVCGTLGEMGRNMGNPPFANRETLPLIRKQELQEACEAIGIEDLRLLGLRDKTIEFEDPEELADRYKRIIQEVRPSLIITFYPGYSVHPDHDATGAAVIRAVEKIDAAERPTVHCVAFSKNTYEELGDPDIIHDVSAASDKKINAIKAHRSQTAWFMQGLSEKQPELLKRINEERFWTYPFDK